MRVFAVGIDPETAAFRPNARDLHNRYFLLEGYSPGAIDAAAKRLGGKIDFCLIDAMHTHDHVLAGTLRFTILSTQASTPPSAKCSPDPLTLPIVDF